MNCTIQLANAEATAVRHALALARRAGPGVWNEGQVAMLLAVEERITAAQDRFREPAPALRHAPFGTRRCAYGIPSCECLDEP
jgi:hypothetical protein